MTLANEEAAGLGTFARWSKVEIQLLGPESKGMDNSANPFRVPVDVKFTGPGGTFVVPAFYDGDGKGGLNGNVWKVRFSPNAAGTWTYTSKSSNSLLDERTDTFKVTEPTGCTAYTPGGLPEFRCVGRLESVGDHYLKFADGPYWLKGGANEPEDFLAPGQTMGFRSKEAAIDYLAGKGVNSLYLMTHNVEGDRRNVWPWVGGNMKSAKANDEHFDVAKLAQWERWFDYMQSRGLVIHLVLEDDSAWKGNPPKADGFSRALYYREIIARFGHYNGLYWNISEEYNENYSNSQVKSFAQMVGDLDAYDHPITVHNEGALKLWDPFVRDSRFGLTSFQVHEIPKNAAQWFHQAAAEWFQKVEKSGWTIPIAFDDVGLGDDPRDLTRKIIWSVYLGGANYEMLTWTTYTDFAQRFEDMTRARAVIESLPFWRMRPSNSLLKSGTGYVFAQIGEAYAVYLPGGGNIKLDLSSNTNSYSAQWLNPRDGATQDIKPVVGDGVRSFAAPDSNDWTLLLRRRIESNVAPKVSSQSAETEVDTPLDLTLSYTDPDGRGPYTFAIGALPSQGALSGSGADRRYTPAAGYIGSDSFTWKVNDGQRDSNTATVTITTSETITLANTLLSDTFNRKNSALVGLGWVEVEGSKASLAIANNKLFFADTADESNRPLVRRKFSAVSRGTLRWSFNFDWARTSKENDYHILMQLGDSGAGGMSDANQNTGVGVNLVWARINGVHQSLGFRQAGVTTPIAILSGPAAISVVADLNTRTYSVAVNGVVVQSSIRYDTDVALDTVRFLTDILNERNFSGRTFDNVIVSASNAANSSPAADAGPDQSAQPGATVSLDGSGSVDADGDAINYSWTLTAVPAGSRASLNGEGAVSPNLVADLPGIYVARLVVNDGQVDGLPDTVSITAGSPPATLVSDTFDRPDSLVVGTGWLEVEQSGASVAISDNKLHFAETSDLANRPLVKRVFPQVSDGSLQWEFDFDWTRTGGEGTYRFMMQLGDSALMSDASQNDGAGVNLIWTSIKGAHQSLAYSKGGVDTALAVLSGPAAISVAADLDTKTYSVAVNGSLVGSGIPFDTNVPLDAVRWFTDQLNEKNFSSRTIDNLKIFSSKAPPPGNALSPG